MKSILCKKLVFSIAVACSLLIGAFGAFRISLAQENTSINVQTTYEGRVRSVIEEHLNTHGGYYQKLEIEILNNELQGKIFTVENGLGDTPTTQNYSKNDVLVLTGSQGEGGETHLYISDYVRRGSLLSLFLHL